MSTPQANGQVNLDGEVTQRVKLKFDGLGTIAYDLPEGEIDERFVRVTYIGRIGKNNDGPELDSKLKIKGYSYGREVAVNKESVELSFIDEAEAPQ